MAASVRNTAIKRIQGDVREMMTNPSDQYAAAPLEVLRGGIYHGRIILPSDYPFKPPNIMLLTPNGRFEVKKKICLSISAYHPEEWQPAWGVRLILEALISFMPTKGEGAIGALDFPAEERRRLAKLVLADLLPELESENEEKEVEKKPSKYAEQIAQLHMHSLETAPPANANKETETVSAEVSENSKQEASAAAGAQTAQEEDSVESKPAKTEEAATTEVSESTASTQSIGAATIVAPAEEPEAAEAAPGVIDHHQNVDTPIAAHNVAQVRESDSVDTFLHYLTIAIVVALFALIYKKLLQMHGILQ
ncbi:Ubiquitin-conjugating enzyme/RWD-like [Phytophthora cactorum]|nr:Ubiquitin-conjugating enzyme/RWD-like [Phytophthora cactorum]